MGLALVPLYALGLARALRRRPLGAAHRAAYLPPLAGTLVFFVFFYRWADKRFLLYAFPFAVCLLAEGFEVVTRAARKSAAATAICAAYLVVAILWNSIRYPDYGTKYLALTPTRFLEAVPRGKPDLVGNDAFTLRGARVVALNADLRSALSGALFDFSQRPPACDVHDPAYTALLALAPELDRRLGRGTPIGYHDLPGFPQWNSAMLRLANVLRRPIVLPPYAEYAIAAEPVPGTVPVLRCGPYRLVRTLR
jgi:hypothetical protein